MSKRSFRNIIVAGPDNVIPVDYRAETFELGIIVWFDGTCTGNVTIQHTFDNVQAADYLPANGRWFPTNGLTAVTANAEGNIVIPVTAVRALVNSIAGASATTSGPNRIHVVYLQSGW